MSQTPDDPTANPAQDPIKALWQGQEPETPAMTVQAIRLLVKDNEARQRHFLLFGLAATVFATSVFIWSAWTAPTTLVRIGDLVMLGWLPAMLWRLYERRPGRAPGPQASVQGLLDFYRAEVVRQAPSLRFLVLSMTPLFVGMVLIGSEVIRKLLQTPGHWVRAWPLAALMALWVVVMVFETRRRRRRVAERLADLDALRG